MFEERIKVLERIPATAEQRSSFKKSMSTPLTEGKIPQQHCTDVALKYSTQRMHPNKLEATAAESIDSQELDDDMSQPVLKLPSPFTKIISSVSRCVRPSPPPQQNDLSDDDVPAEVIDLEKWMNQRSSKPAGFVQASKRKLNCTSHSSNRDVNETPSKQLITESSNNQQRKSEFQVSLPRAREEYRESSCSIFNDEPMCYAYQMESGDPQGESLVEDAQGLEEFRFTTSSMSQGY
jgi:hypothetical protein